ncbi:MAG: hypothetical protein MMC23_009982, partial [Stictis urceolatum]|nr:hypothetical protein [Stictis urceolata]
VAQNQAAGSGSHMANSMKYLLEQAQGNKDARKDYDGTEAFSFTITLNQREVYLWIIFVKDEKFVMSPVNSYHYWKPSDIQACNSALKNVLDYGLDDRKPIMVRALADLFPVPAHWRIQHGSSEASTSFSE